MCFEYLDEEFNSTLHALEMVLDSYEPISDYKLIFEADDPQVQQQTAMNAQKEQAGESFAMKMIQSIKKMIQQVISKIKNFFSTLVMSNDEKARYQAFLQKCKTDPALKGKKVTLTDYRKVNGEYEALIKQADTMIHNMKDDQPTAVNELVEKMQNAVKGVSQGASVIVTAEILDKMAASNREVAEFIYNKLNSDEASMKILEENMGKEKAADYKKRMAMFKSKCLLTKWKVALRHKQYANAQECIEQTMREVKGLMSGDLAYGNKTDPHKFNKLKNISTDKISGLFGKSSVGLIGKGMGNKYVQGVANAAKLMGKDVKRGVRQDFRTTFGLSRNSRYERLKNYGPEPKREDYDNNRDYIKAKQKWEAKKAKKIQKQNQMVQKETDRITRRSQRNTNTRDQSLSSFVGGKHQGVTDTIDIARNISNFFR